MPQPILPTIHPQINDTQGSFSSIPQEPNSTKQYIISLEDDPVWMKCKSVVFHGAGRVQSKLGIVTGMEAFANRGQAWVSWAAHASEQADFLTEHGAPSRLHGEYTRWVGYFGKMLGQPSLPSETQYYCARMTDQQANNETEV